MAFFCRLNQSKLRHLSNQFKRHYFQISRASSVDSTNRVSEYCRPAYFGDKVRFYAAPVQFQGKEKKEEKNTNGPRLNDKIKAETVRLVFDDGHTILSLREALARARELQQDLVEVQPKANPPVCKIMDFHKEKYKKQIKEKDRVKSKAEASLRKGDHKEVRFTGKTEEKDLKMKADMVKRLMDRGYRVKCSAKGGEDQDLGGLLSRLSALIEDVAVVESGPRLEKGQAYVIVRHVKFGPLKKGGGGKVTKALANARQEAKSGTTPQVSAAGFTSPEKEEMDPEESDSEVTWSVVERDDDLDKVFNFKDESTETPAETTAKKMNVVSDLLQPRQLPDSGATNSVLPSRQDSSIKTDNRYKKIEPANRFQPPNAADKGRVVRDSFRPETQIRDRRSHPPTNANFVPSMRETRQDENYTSASRYIKHPSNGTPKPGPSHHTNPGPSTTDFGIFSSTNAPGKSNAGATSYRSNQGPSHTPSTNPNVPGAKSDDSLNKGQKSWGIFSKGSNDSSNRISKPN